MQRKMARDFFRIALMQDQRLIFFRNAHGELANQTAPGAVWERVPMEDLSALQRGREVDRATYWRISMHGRGLFFVLLLYPGMANRDFPEKKNPQSHNKNSTIVEVNLFDNR